MKCYKSNTYRKNWKENKSPLTSIHS